MYIIIAAFFHPDTPNSSREYKENGYYFIEESWFKDDGLITYKRWRSVSRYDKGQDINTIKYKLDSDSTYSEYN